MDASPDVDAAADLHGAAYSNGHADTNGDANGNSNPNARTHCDVHPNPHGNEHANARPDRCSPANEHLDPDRDSNVDPDAHTRGVAPADVGVRRGRQCEVPRSPPEGDGVRP